MPYQLRAELTCQVRDRTAGVLPSITVRLRRGWSRHSISFHGNGTVTSSSTLSK